MRFYERIWLQFSDDDDDDDARTWCQDKISDEDEEYVIWEIIEPLLRRWRDTHSCDAPGYRCGACTETDRLLARACEATMDAAGE